MPKSGGKKSKKTTYSKNTKIKSYKGNAITIDTKDRSGLSIREYKQIKKMMPKIEVKLGPVTQKMCWIPMPFNASNLMYSFPIIGATDNTGSGGPMNGSDFLISRGTGSGQRIGDRIAPRSVITNIHISVNPTHTSQSIPAGEYVCRWFLYRTKSSQFPVGQGGPNNVDFGQWFDQGGDVNTPPNSNVTDFYQLVNKNVYTVYKEGRFTFQIEVIKTPPNGDLVTQPMQSSKSVVHKHIRIDSTKYVAKVLKYNDDRDETNLGCTNDALFWTCLVSRADNEIMDDVLNVNVAFMTQLRYTDA